MKPPTNPIQKHNTPPVRHAAIVAKILALAGLLLSSPHARGRDFSIFQRESIAAWCIVPFDAKQRGPVERAEMLNRLGITRLAYDWRAQHIPTFDAEVVAMKAHGIEISAWWVSAGMDETNRKIFEVIGRHKIRPQLWSVVGEPAAPDQAAKVKAVVDQIRPLAVEALRHGCKLALYNHGGWFGEPDNQIAVIEELKMPNVGIVYNFHHGHAHIDGFKELFGRMKPHLLALNLNGMIKGGEKILPIGAGDQEQRMIEVVLGSGWKGPVGILCHLMEDAEVILEGNLKGLENLLGNLRTQACPGCGGPCGAGKAAGIQGDPGRQSAKLHARGRCGNPGLRKRLDAPAPRPRQHALFTTCTDPHSKRRQALPSASLNQAPRLLRQGAWAALA